jgi:probable rRNA maturation factor
MCMNCMIAESKIIDAAASTGEVDAPSDDEPGPSPAGVVLMHDAWRDLPGAVPAVHAAVNAAIAFVPALADSEIAIALSSDASVRELNARFRGQDKSTNVLSFPAARSSPATLTQGADASGDIIIAYEAVMSEAAGEGKDALHHLTHLTVHGLLHLAGYDHDADADADRMEALERHILHSLDIPDPYRSDFEGDLPRITAGTPL